MRRITELSNIDIAISRAINSRYDKVRTVANSIADVIMVANTLTPEIVVELASLSGVNISEMVAAVDTISADKLIVENQTAIATTQANSSLASSIAANVSAGEAEVNKVLVESLYKHFDSRYLGSKVMDPAVDNYGNDLLVGAMYFNEATSTFRFYTGSVWVDPQTIITQAQQLVSADALQTSSDAVQTGLDRTAVSSNLNLTNNSRDAAAISASNAATSATNAETFATNASANVVIALESKVDKVTGKGLSTVDFTDTLHAKVNDALTSETLTSLSSTDNTLTYIDEVGTSNQVVLDNLDADTLQGSTLPEVLGAVPRSVIYHTDTGVANAIHLNNVVLPNYQNTLEDGMVVFFSPAYQNTGAATLKVNGLVEKIIKFKDSELSADMLLTDVKYMAIYKLSDDSFHVDIVANNQMPDELVDKNYVDSRFGTKADLEGSVTQRFKVSDAVTADDAVTKRQIDALQSGSLTDSGTATLTNKTISTDHNTISVVEADITDFGSYATNNNLNAHTGDTANPHSVTKEQVGLDSVPNVDTTNASNIDTGTLSANRLPTIISSNTTGNAATASTLDTARTITLSGDVTGSASFDGSSNLDIAVASASTGNTNHERVISLANNAVDTWSKVGEMRGGSINGGADLTFSVKNVNYAGTLERAGLEVMSSQRGVGGVSVKVYLLGQYSSIGVTIGHVQLNNFDFDIYLKRDIYNPCSVVGQDSTLNGFFDNFGEVTTEPTGIIYAPIHTILNSEMDTGWVLPTLTNGWFSYPVASHLFRGCRKMPDGTVVMGGLIAGGAVTTYHNICTLPLGYRPYNSVIFTVPVSGAGTHAIGINSNGNVVFRYEGNGNPGTWLSLSGISFSTN